jgi:hypothetical protein
MPAPRESWLPYLSAEKANENPTRRVNQPESVLHGILFEKKIVPLLPFGAAEAAEWKAAGEAVRERRSVH